MRGMIDPETLDLMIRLQLEDTETLMKGKHRIGKAPDGEFAMQLFKKELESLSVFNTDRIMCRSIAQAVRHDANEIQNAVSNEEQATYDRQYAVCLSAKRPYRPSQDKTQQQKNDAIDEEMLAKLASMYMDDDCRPESSGHANGSGSPDTKMQKEAKPTRRCVSCLDDFSYMDTAQCPCGDHYCRDCMANLFEMAIGDESLFPVRCCKRPIPVALGQIFLSPELVGRYRAKKLEYETPNRTYCHEKACATFVPPQFIVGNDATCVRCSAKTCKLCKGPRHQNSDCPRDTVTADILRLAKSQGWKRCFSCRTMIELNTGCNHITCRCGAQFCYECGNKWKTCSCAQWQEMHLYDRANAIVDRDGNQRLGCAERAARVERERQNLVANHECSHNGWSYRKGAFQCEECRCNLPDFIFECTTCRILACRRCRYNRL